MTLGTNCMYFNIVRRYRQGCARDDEDTEQMALRRA